MYMFYVFHGNLSANSFLMKRDTEVHYIDKNLSVSLLLSNAFATHNNFIFARYLQSVGESLRSLLVTVRDNSLKSDIGCR